MDANFAPDYQHRLQYLDKKFEFKYSSENLTVADKIAEEDQFALSTLQSPETLQTVKEIGARLADFLERTVPDGEKNSFLKRVNKLLESKIGTYPVSTEEITSFGSLVNTLRTHDSPVTLLSLIWPIFTRGNADGAEIDRINLLYATKISETKDYVDDKNKKHLPNSARFGNSGHVDSVLFSENKFHPYVRDVDYRVINSNSDNKIVKKMQSNSTPYVAGLSGMANMTCKVLSVQAKLI